MARLSTVAGSGGVPGTDYDQLVVSNTATINGGELQVTLDQSFTPNLIDTFTILTSATLVGDFDAFSGVLVNNDLTIVPIAGATNYTLTAAIPGDSDLNGIVNFAYFVNVANNFNAVGTVWAQGNFDFNGLTNFADFVILANHFGQMVPSPDAVPEPGVLALWFLTGWGLGLHRLPLSRCQISRSQT